MIKQGVWIRILVFINVLLGFVVFVSCAPEIYLARKNLRKDPLHKDNIPEKPVCPIDGLWKDPYHGYKSGIEKGRLFTANTIMIQGHDMSWPMVSVKEIVRVAPGKYRGLMMEHGKGWKPCTFSVISKKELVQKSEGKIVGLYQKIRCDDEQCFLRDFDDMIRQAQTAEVSVAQIQPSDIQAQRNPEATQTASLSEHFVAKKSSITIYNMSICPAAITPGSKFDLQFEYMINDPSLSNDLVLAQFSYCILENEKIIARSKPTVIECEGGQKIEEIIHLVGSTHKGVYTIQITLQYKGEVIEKRGELVICDKPQVMVQEPPRGVVTQQQIPSMNVMPDPGTLGKYRSNVGSIYYFRVTGQDSGNIYGTDVYTDDSQLATAAVHAGVLARGQQGVVKVTILPGQPRYQGSFRNGINSHSWGMWRSSYTVTEAKMF